VFIFVNFSFALFTPPPSRRLSRGDLVELLGGLLCVAVFDPLFLDHLPCLDHFHLPVDP
jgi:hypothetical protein